MAWLVDGVEDCPPTRGERREIWDLNPVFLSPTSAAVGLGYRVIRKLGMEKAGGVCGVKRKRVVLGKKEVKLKSSPRNETR